MAHGRWLPSSRRLLTVSTRPCVRRRRRCGSLTGNVTAGGLFCLEIQMKRRRGARELRGKRPQGRRRRLIRTVRLPHRYLKPPSAALTLCFHSIQTPPPFLSCLFFHVFYLFIPTTSLAPSAALLIPRPDLCSRRCPKVWWRLALRIEITRIGEVPPPPSCFGDGCRGAKWIFHIPVSARERSGNEYPQKQTGDSGRPGEAWGSGFRGENTNK